MSAIKFFALIYLGVVIVSCSTFDSDYDPTKDWSAAKLYAEAKESLDGGNFERSIELFESLEARYPFGRYARQAQLDSAYAYYKHDEPDSAIASADRFIKLHPRNPHVDYAYYLKGLANFNRGQHVLSAILPNNPASRDPTPLMRAFEDFSLLVKSYPDSRYADDARQRMVFLRNKLAEHEMKVADFYMRRGAYAAAVNRSKYVLENYQGATSVPLALKTMIKACRTLGLDEIADDAQRVLTKNYPKEATDFST